MTLARPGKCINWLVFSLCSWFLRAWSGRRPKTRRNVLIGTACVIYVFFLVTQVAHVLPQQREHKRRNDRRTEDGEAPFTGIPLDNTFQTDAAGPDVGFINSVATTLKPNVVYITLRSKRSKPANIRGTVKPKKRKKQVSPVSSSRGSDKQEPGHLVGGERQNAEEATKGRQWKPGAKTATLLLGNVKVTGQWHSPEHDSNIRIYSEHAPSWFSKEDIQAMRFLADSRVAAIQQVRSRHGSLILFESDRGSPRTPSSSGQSYSRISEPTVCHGSCGLIKSPLDTTEIFAFHLDRILGLNRTLPSVSRRFAFLQVLLAITCGVLWCC